MKMFLISKSPFPQSLQILFDPEEEELQSWCHSAHIQQAEAQQESAQRAVVYSPESSVTSVYQAVFPHYFNMWGFTQF